jgi:acetyl-CoA carboxylase biotin carboxyl carrier protein
VRDPRPPIDPAAAVTEVLQLVRGTSISELEVEWEGGLVRLRREPGAVANTSSEAAPAAVTGEVTISSSSVGVFHYPPGGTFPQVGDLVQQGETIAEVETLQLRTAVPATVEGVLIAVLVEDLTPVEYGQPLAVVHATDVVPMPGAPDA